jgi:hypothetical protein
MKGESSAGYGWIGTASVRSFLRATVLRYGRSGRGGGDKRGAEGEAGRGGGSSGGGGREKDRDAEGLERVLEKERAQLEKDRARVAEEKRKAAELLAKAKNQYRVFKHPDRYAGRYNFKKVAQQVG